MQDSLKRFFGEEEGQDLVEYALLLVFAVLPTLGKAITRRTQRCLSGSRVVPQLQLKSLRRSGEKSCLNLLNITTDTTQQELLWGS